MSSGIIASSEHVAGSCRNYHATAAWTNSALNAKLNRARREIYSAQSDVVYFGVIYPEPIRCAKWP